jgi:benzoate-CoA ligase
MVEPRGRRAARVGLRLEDRVLIVLPDCPEFVWTWFGANRVGGVITMVNPLLPADDYVYYLEYTRARVAVIHESLLENFTQAAKESKHFSAERARRRRGAREFLSFEQAVNCTGG